MVNVEKLLMGWIYRELLELFLKVYGLEILEFIDDFTKVEFRFKFFGLFRFLVLGI